MYLSRENVYIIDVSCVNQNSSYVHQGDRKSRITGSIISHIELSFIFHFCLNKILFRPLTTYLFLYILFFFFYNSRVEEEVNDLRLLNIKKKVFFSKINHKFIFNCVFVGKSFAIIIFNEWLIYLNVLKLQYFWKYQMSSKSKISTLLNSIKKNP